MKNFLIKHKSNILFIAFILILLNTPLKEVLLRQFAMSPAISEVENKISNYDWELRGLNAQNLDFERLKGKVVFVNFWATWCPPCRAELPMIQELYNDYKDKVAFVFVTNEKWNVVSSFFKKNTYELPVYNSITSPPAEFLKTNSIPATYVLDKSGNIVIEEVGAADWNSAKTRKILDDLLKE